MPREALRVVRVGRAVRAVPAVRAARTWAAVHYTLGVVIGLLTAGVIIVVAFAVWGT